MRLLDQARIDRAINKLCAIRNTVTLNFDVDYQMERELQAVEEAIESLAQEVES